MICIVAAFLAVLFAGLPARANDPAMPPQLQNVGFDQHLDQPIPLDVTFTDETGKEVKLGDYFTDKPVILVLAYFRCPMLCTQVLNGLVTAMRETKLALGQDYRVLTVSFDPRDTPQMAAIKRVNYLKNYGGPGEDGWHFLTGKEENIQQLASAVGFRYVYDAKNDQYAHASGITILTPGGKISRYLFDVNFSSRDLRLALIEASQNKIGTPADQVLLFCLHYDPAAGRYGAAIMRLVRVGGVVTLLALGTFMGMLWWKERKHRPVPIPPATSEEA